MKEMYEAPEVEFIECQVEKGFAASDGEEFGFGDAVENGATRVWWDR